MSGSSLLSRSIAPAVVLLLLGAGLWFFRNPFIARSQRTSEAVEPNRSPIVSRNAIKTLELSPQARTNLGIVSGPAKLQSYWRSIQIPGEIMDRPGISDRGVTAPAVGVITQVHAFPGDIVQPGDKLFTLRLLSEYIQNSQAELFRVTREILLVQEQKDRLVRVGDSSAVPQVRIIELDQQLRRLQASLQSHRQDLLTRGVKPEQLAEIVEGRFAAEIEVVAPPFVQPTTASSTSPPTAESPLANSSYEVQNLQVDLGTQVQAGQSMMILANHRDLWIAGKAFKREAPYLEQAAQHHWPIQVEFSEDTPDSWPAQQQVFEIRHLANTIDANNRTFDFFIPLMNQSRSYFKDGQQFVVWRFRPGGRVRLHVPVEEMKDVFVLPAGAVVHEGPDTFVFRQNGDLFDRLAVRKIYEDRLSQVIANDGSISPGWFLAQSNAASLNRILKAQAASGVPAGLHVHADGTVHGAH